MKRALRFAAWLLFLLVLVVAVEQGSSWIRAKLI